MSPATGLGAVKSASASKDLLIAESKSEIACCYGRKVSFLPTLDSLFCCKGKPSPNKYVVSPVYKPTTIEIITSQPSRSESGNR